MGFLNSSLSDNRENISLSDIDEYAQLYHAMLSSAIQVLPEWGYSNVSEVKFPCIKNDYGFYSELREIIDHNSHYLFLRSLNVEAFRNMLNVFLLAGIYIVCCSYFSNKPLSISINEIMFRFKQQGPLECVMNFLENKIGPHQVGALDYIANEVVEHMQKENLGFNLDLEFEYENSVGEYCIALYNVGNAIAFWYVDREGNK